MKKRNGIAQAAQFRNSAGSMKHRNTPRGGARNQTAEFLQDAVSEACDHAIEHGNSAVVDGEGNLVLRISVIGAEE